MGSKSKRRVPASHRTIYERPFPFWSHSKNHSPKGGILNTHLPPLARNKTRSCFPNTWKDVEVRLHHFLFGYRLNQWKAYQNIGLTFSFPTSFSWATELRCLTEYRILGDSKDTCWEGGGKVTVMSSLIALFYLSTWKTVESKWWPSFAPMCELVSRQNPQT